MVARKERALFCILVVAVAFCLNGVAFALEWGTKELETEKTSVMFSNDVKKGGYKVVTTEELKSWVDAKGDMLIVDTMPFEDSYKKNHIPGAVQMEFPIEPMPQLDEEKRAQLEKLLGPDKDRKVVFYCGFTKCTRSHNAALWATKLGYTNVYRHPGGIKAWQEADYSIEKAQ